MTADGPVRVTMIPTEVVRIGAMASTLVAILPTPLGAELDRFALPFEREPPTQGELRVAQAQLVGRLEGLFHGIQFALFVQQVAAPAAGREPVSSSGPYL
jgi:hypothetical protein